MNIYWNFRYKRKFLFHAQSQIQELYKKWDTTNRYTPDLRKMRFNLYLKKKQKTKPETFEGKWYRFYSNFFRVTLFLCKKKKKNKNNLIFLLFKLNSYRICCKWTDWGTYKYVRVSTYIECVYNIPQLYKEFDVLLMLL